VSSLASAGGETSSLLRMARAERGRGGEVPGRAVQAAIRGAAGGARGRVAGCVEESVEEKKVC
jgi:hypothetical protein